MRSRQADLVQIRCRAASFYSCMILGKLPDLPSRKQGLAWGRRTAWFLGGFLVLEGAWGTPQGNQVMPGSPRWVPEAGLVSRVTRRQQVQHHSCPRHPQVLGGWERDLTHSQGQACGIQKLGLLLFFLSRKCSGSSLAHRSQVGSASGSKASVWSISSLRGARAPFSSLILPRRVGPDGPHHYLL